MLILGLDIGTTTISAVVTEQGQVLDSLTLPNGSFLPNRAPCEKVQDPQDIRATALRAVETLFDRWPDIQRIGLTGQMHGIVYLNAAGEPVSPLYTWQDGRGDQPCENGGTYAGRLSELTGYAVSTGYGMVTHFYNLQNGLVPETAVVFCTIHDYIAMVLTGNTTPVTDVSDAASLGLFRVEAGEFDLSALRRAEIDPAMLPRIAAAPLVGRYADRADVYAAIGDNQASFLGACGGQTDRMLINMGTGGQFSVYTRDPLSCPGLETRPFPGGGHLLVGASLCGGRAYALLETFFRMTARAMGAEPESCYDGMAALLAQGKPEDLPVLTPLFQGTRQDPTLRGSITGLSTENLTPRHLTWAMLEGMAEELYQMYALYLRAGGKPVKLLGSGNGLRRNPWLQQCFSEKFGLPLQLSDCREEAATGAAAYAAMQ